VTNETAPYRLLLGDCLARLAELPDASVQVCVTSPPYFGLRDYQVDGQIGLEDTPDCYVARLVEVFREVRRVLADDGTLWLNLGDSYAATMKGGGGTGSGTLNCGQHHNINSTTRQMTGNRRYILSDGLKPKDLIGIPWMVAFALRADGWYLRSDIIWHKPNPMPESVRDRPTKAHEYLFLLAKNERYFYDADAIREPHQERTRGNNPHGAAGDHYKIGRDGSGNGRGTHPTGVDGHLGYHPEGRNRRTVWTVTPKPFKDAHFAVMPPELVRPCVKAGSRPGDTVLDPFSGAATVGVVALEEGRRYVGIELNPLYLEMSRRRIEAAQGLFAAAV
jgi:DNA modification methylase